MMEKTNINLKKRFEDASNVLKERKKESEKKELQKRHHVRFTDYLWNKILHESIKQGMSRSSYLRMATNRQLEIDSNEEKERLKKICSLISRKRL